MKTKFFYFFILLTVFLVPLSQFLNARLLLLTLFLSLFHIQKVRVRLRHLLVRSWDIAICSMVVVGGLLYSQDLHTGLTVLEADFCFLVVPIIFSSLDEFNEQVRDKLLYAFLFGLLAASLICLANAVIRYSHDGDLQVFFFNQLTELLRSQPTYLAYYLIFALTYLLYLLHYEKSEWNPILLVLAITFFFLMLMLTGGRTTFISMLLIFSFFVLKFLVEAKSFSSKLAFVSVVTMTICMFLVTATVQNDRDLVLNDSWDRLVLWESAMNATNDWIWGVGTGDYKQVLNEYYRTHNLTEFAVDSYNAHNQFLQTLLTNGILGLFAVLLLICRPLYLSVKNQDVLGTLVFFPFLIYGMTEVFLGRYQGIVFFALLHQVFISLYTSSKPLSSALKGA